MEMANHTGQRKQTCRSKWTQLKIQDGATRNVGDRAIHKERLNLNDSSIEFVKNSINYTNIKGIFLINSIMTSNKVNVR